MEKTWVIAKQRGGKFIIQEVQENVTTYEGQRIPISEKRLAEIKDVLKSAYEITMENNKIVVAKKTNLEAYDRINRFVNRTLKSVKTKHPELYNVTRAHKVKCYYDGTYRLMRSSSKDVIWIASRNKCRSEKAPFGVSDINHVCIDDNTKIKFFSDADYYNIPIGKKHYISISDGSVFRYWADLMNTEYKEQVEHALKK